MDKNIWVYSGMLVNLQAILLYLELDVFNSLKTACSNVLIFSMGSDRAVFLTFASAAQKVLDNYWESLWALTVLNCVGTEYAWKSLLHFPFSFFYLFSESTYSWATWSSCACPCSLQESWTSWSSKIPSSTSDCVILLFTGTSEMSVTKLSGNMSFHPFPSQPCT